MPAWEYIFGVIALLTATVLAIDWFAAGRVKGRGVGAKDQYSSDASVGHTVFERRLQSLQEQTGPPT